MISIHMRREKKSFNQIMTSSSDSKTDKIKNAVVTGAAGDIGKAIVKLFAENGINVWACMRQLNEETEAFFHTLEEGYLVAF